MRLAVIAMAFLVSPLLSAVAPAAEPPPPTDEEIPVLLKQLDKSGNASFEAAKRLEPVAERIVDPLIQKLKSKKPFARWWAAYLLAKSRDPRALEPLARIAVKDPDSTVRSTAVYWIRIFGSERSWRAVVGALADPDPAVRGWAMKAIEQSRYMKALPAIRKLTGSPSPKTRYDAV